ncbi:prolyl 4-hydroxylase [Novosphingobium sp. PhB165]|uniref:prolyl hydroxylase family protein n=1 Tax=Novosphingobium sp. PhB165 TaxID=2485105 RepID=UPI001046C093|nr:2OG-Fe(II) oxygenase [Novosphingobium sp. PhB165]TCM21935.1 prolyl 4-hydroxylase [Novosphingobium sp. PhB165]
MRGENHPDCEALARIGAGVRDRLARVPSAHRAVIEGAEIYTVADFISADACHRLTSLIDAVACPSRLVEEEDWEGYRTSYSGDIDPADPTIRALERDLSRLTGLDAARSECAQGQRYRCGEYYHEHCDWFDTDADYWPQEDGNGGQRSWTAMVYLNTVELGGYTDFTKLGLRVTPQPGTLLLWNNACPDGSPNPWTLHAARPVERGVKYVVTKWYRARRWQ